jgi:ABC-type siderophore export system fused ATPase/permease subunit
VLGPLIRRHRTALVLATLLAAASGAVSITLLATINRLAATGLSRGDLAPIVSGLGWLAALLGLSAGSQILLARLGADLVAALRLDLSLRFLTIDYERLIQRKHLVVSALIQDIGRLSPMALLGPQLAYNLFLILLGCIYLARVSAPLFGVLAVFHCLTLALGWIIEHRTRIRFDALRQADDQVFAHFRALSDGKKELSLSRHRARHFTDAVLRPAIAQARDRMEHVHRGAGLYQTVATGSA